MIDDTAGAGGRKEENSGMRDSEWIFGQSQGHSYLEAGWWSQLVTAGLKIQIDGVVLLPLSFMVLVEKGTG